MKIHKIDRFVAAAAMAVVLVSSAQAETIDLSGVYTADQAFNRSTDTTIRLNGVSFHDCQLKLTGDVTYTLELVEGTTSTFLIDGEVNDVNCAAIKATKRTNLVIGGAGKLKVEASKKMSVDKGVIVCSNLTVRSGSTAVTFDKDKSDSPCFLVKGDYLQTGGKVSVDLNKKNCTNEFYGVRMDTKNSTFTIEDGEFNAEISGTKSRAIDLKKSSVATFKSGDFTAFFEGPEGRFVSGGTIVIEGGNFTFSTNITAKMTSAYYPTYLSAVKADSSITVSGGDFEADLPLEGSEVLTNDSETGTDITISGGTFDLVAGNDCIHANGDINVSGGRLRAVSTGDDALDANGSLTISGGDVRAYATVEGAHGLDVNNGKVSGVKKTLTISGGTVIATDGLNAIKIGTAGSSEVGNVSFKQPTYYGTISDSSKYSQKYLSLEGKTNNVTFVVKPCLPVLEAGPFNLLVSVHDRTASQPAPLTAEQAYADRSSACPLVFEKKAKVSGQTVTTKEGAVLTLPDYYDLDPSEGKSKTIRLSLNTNAAPELASVAVGTSVDIGVPTQSGLYYQLQKSAAAGGSWTDDGSKIAGDGKMKTLSTAKSGASGFFRATVTDVAK